VTLCAGPMFSGKSSWLLRRLAERERQGWSALLLKSAKDTRYASSEVVAHSGERRACLSVDALSDASAQCAGVEVVALDEAQFLPDLRELTCELADSGKHLFVAGLDADFQRKQFGDVCNLLPIADSVVKLSSSCFLCGADAPFSLRIAGSTEQVELGGSDRYRAACRRCYIHFHRSRASEAVGAAAP